MRRVSEKSAAPLAALLFVLGCACARPAAAQEEPVRVIWGRVRLLWTPARDTAPAGAEVEGSQEYATV